METLFTGRKKALTGCLPVEMQFPGYIGDTLDETTIAREVANSMAVHRQNAAQHAALKQIYLGNQEILHRAANDRRADNRIVVNFAQAFTRDITGYSYGSGIQYVARDAEKLEAIQALNNMVAAESKNAINKSMGDNQSIGGRGFIAVLPDSLERNGVPFEFLDLDPETTEVVYSTYNNNVPVFAYTQFVGSKDGKNLYVWKVWTAARCYTVTSEDASMERGVTILTNTISLGSEDVTLAYTPNLIGEIPIVEYRNNQFGLGDWECAIPLFNAINSMASDSLNDVEQAVVSYLALFGVDLDTSDQKTMNSLRQNRLLVFNGVPGINQDAKFVTAQLDGESANQLRAYFEAALKVVVGIPDRDTGQAGSDTGVSAQIRTGSGDLEIVAQNKCLYTVAAERRVLRIILKILELKGRGLGIDESDVDVEIPRSKTDNLQSKVQAGATMHGMGMAKVDIVNAMDISTDMAGVVTRWEAEEERAAQKAREIAAMSKPTEVTEDGDGSSGDGTEAVSDS